jgi:hypothetical protein
MKQGRFSPMDRFDEIDNLRADCKSTLYDCLKALVTAICAGLCLMDICENFAL